MTIKWTTITEDKSTWPPLDKVVLLSDGQYFAGFLKTNGYGDFYIMVTKSLEIIDDCIGIRWCYIVDCIRRH